MHIAELIIFASRHKESELFRYYKIGTIVRFRKLSSVFCASQKLAPSRAK